MTALLCLCALLLNAASALLLYRAAPRGRHARPPARLLCVRSCGFALAALAAWILALGVGPGLCVMLASEMLLLAALPYLALAAGMAARERD